MPQNQRQSKMQPARLAALLAALKEGEYNSKELAEMSGLHYLTVLEYCRALHAVMVPGSEDRHALLHIAKYEKDRLGRRSIIIYKLGEGVDMVLPKVSRQEQQRNYRQRKRARTRAAEVATTAATAGYFS